jgi:hypothetical protein
VNVVHELITTCGVCVCFDLLPECGSHEMQCDHCGFHWLRHALGPFMAQVAGVPPCALCWDSCVLCALFGLQIARVAMLRMLVMLFVGGGGREGGGRLPCILVGMIVVVSTSHLPPLPYLSVQK